MKYYLVTRGLSSFRISSTINNFYYYMTDSRDRGISQSAFENPGPYIPIRTDISSHYDPSVFIENKAVKKGVKCNLMKLLSMKM